MCIKAVKTEKYLKNGGDRGSKHSILSASAPLPFWDEHSLLMLSADGTSNLGNDVKPKPKRCLVVWHPGSLPQPPLASYPLKDDGGDESDAKTPTMPKCHPHLVAGLPPSAPTTPQIQSTAQELFLSPPPFVCVVGSESAAALPRRAVRAARDDARGAWVVQHESGASLLASLQPVLTLAALNAVYGVDAAGAA
ncbi:hypothetical protein B0H14DRAFT_3143295 [Mycena olivaceomarginata]|nr:hypothetical protein B0H14DRAFT_3143295 [Mycena olivaceomarginata]